MGKNIAVVGSGYVGLVSGACFSDVGHQVTCIDNDAAKISKLRKGVMPIYEPGLEELVARNTARGRLRFSDDISSGTKAAEVVFICVGTPPKPDGNPDLSFVERVGADLARSMSSYKVIVEKSTVPVKTGDWLYSVMKRHIGDVPFDIASNPEFLREGTAIHDTLNPDRVVIGTDSERARGILAQVYELFGSDISSRMIFTSVREAETIKHAANAFLAMKISYANLISRLCDETGADVLNVLAAVGADKRIGKDFLRPGLGYGGSCFPKDVAAFIKVFEEHGIDPTLLNATESVNDVQRLSFANRIVRDMGGVEGRLIGVLGLAFKPDTDDMRSAPSIDIINHLLVKGAKVRAYDPVAMPNAKKFLPTIEYASNPYDAVKGADAIAVMTEWKEFSELDFGLVKDSMKGSHFFDGRNLLDPAAMRRLGFDYRGIGRR